MKIYGSAESEEKLIIENSIFKYNSASPGYFDGGGGGAISINLGKGIIRNCVFEDNIGNGGGAIQGGGTGDLYLINNKFISNRAVFDKGGAILYYGDLFLVNCLFAKNQAFGDGGGIYNLGTNAGLNYSNLTFYKNEAGGSGGACTIGTTHSNITNCIFWENTAGIEGHEIIYGGGSTVYLRGCIFDKPDCDSILGEISTQEYFCEDNNFFNEYPSFKDTLNNDFSLIPCAIGINAGSEIPIIYQGIETDIAGNDRILENIPDIGAYEIESSMISATPLFSDATTETAEDGWAEVQSITGGIAPYSYLWSNGVTFSYITELSSGEYSVTITDSVGCTGVEYFDIGFLTDVLDEENKDVKIHVFPNPVFDEMTILVSNLESPYTISIYDISGKLMFRKENLSRSFNHLDTSDLVSGIYLVEIFDGEVGRRKKVIVR